MGCTLVLPLWTGADLGFSGKVVSKQNGVGFALLIFSHFL